jgi:hypothetical protein
MTTTAITTNKITSILTSRYTTSAIVTTSASTQITEETTNSSTIDKIYANGETTDSSKIPTTGSNIVDTIYSTTYEATGSDIKNNNNSYSTSSTKLVNFINSTTPYVHYLWQQLQGSLAFYFHNNSNQSSQLINILSSYSFNLSPCLVNCSNRGQCVLGNNFELICQCTHSFFTGDSCQYDVRPCSTNKCLYNGTCTNLNNNTQFKCECSQNYYGANCEKQIDVCKVKNVTCSNQGYCLNQANGTAVCKCFLNYYGDNCEFQDAFVKVIKTISVSSLIVLLTSIGLFVLWIVSNDIMNIFITKSRYGENKRQKKPKVIRFKYTPFKKSSKKMSVNF